MNLILFQLKENSIYTYYDENHVKNCSSQAMNYLATFLIYDYKPYDASFLERALLKNSCGHYDSCALIIEENNPNVYICSEYDWDDYLEKHPNSTMSIQELFLEKNLNHFVIRKANLITILYAWNTNLQNKSPYIMLYQESNLTNIDLLSFPSPQSALSFLI